MRNETLQIFCHAFLYVGWRFALGTVILCGLVDVIWNAGFLMRAWDNLFVAFLLVCLAAYILTHRVKRKMEEDSNA